ncbi:MAG: AAA family ATPase [Lachnospiraceae bacterium]|nr:AAA family ATPase [Lachnospiraceae bacterium]
MILHRFIADCSDTEYRDTDKNKSQMEKLFSSRSPLAEINEKLYTEYCLHKNCYIAVTNVVRDKMTIIAACGHEVPVSRCEDLILTVLSDIHLLKNEEITTEEFDRELTAAQQDWFCHSRTQIFRELRIELRPENYSIFEGPPYKIREYILSADAQTKKKSRAALSDILASESFREEIDRIYSARNERRFLGHPVHYLITAGDKAAADDMLEILIPALIANNRLVSGRVCDLQNMQSRAYRDEHFANVFSSMQGGTVVVNLTGDRDAGMYATGFHELADQLGKKLGEYGNQTLFVFVDVSGKRTISDDTIAAILANADMIHIQEGHGDLKRASAYLKRLADKTEYKNVRLREITKYMPKDRDLFSVSDIYTAYNKWYGSGLKTHVYKAYKEKDIVRIEPKKKTDKPYEELQKMIGLTDVKKVTDEILAVAKMQKMRREMGLVDTQASMHMLFSGNPGTAKTTVARLLAQILKEEEVLTNGHIVECGRQDLVGRYVGWTAKIVEEKFLAARGGVMFIDEAYSLVEDGKTYGAEAINTIVQAMENYRSETIVIFAGYPDRMREFLEQNEGLASRIAFHLDFPDYSPEELIGIMELMLSKQGYRIGEDVRDRCLRIFQKACREENYGNGRFVRNMVEHAMMHQADRLLKGKQSPSVTKEEAGLLIADDFEMIGMKKTEARTFGFM